MSSPGAFPIAPPPQGMLIIHYCCSRGARGLGKNMAEAMCQVGCKAVALLDVRQEEGDETALELIKKYGTNVKFYQIDVTDDEKVAKIMLTVCPAHFHHPEYDF